MSRERKTGENDLTSEAQVLRDFYLGKAVGLTSLPENKIDGNRIEKALVVLMRKAWLPAELLERDIYSLETPPIQAMIQVKDYFENKISTILDKLTRNTEGQSFLRDLLYETLNEGAKRTLDGKDMTPCLDGIEFALYEISALKIPGGRSEVKSRTEVVFDAETTSTPAQPSEIGLDEAETKRGGWAQRLRDKARKTRDMLSGKKNLSATGFDTQEIAS